MKSLDTDTNLFFGVLLIFVVCYVLSWPMGWLISDEYSYLNQALAAVNGNKSHFFTDTISGENVIYNFTPYAMGNSFWLAFWIKTVGLKFAYFGSFLSVIFGSILSFRVLKKENFPLIAGLLFFVYPPLIFFSKSFMSGVPSLLLSALFFYKLFQKEENWKKWFLLSFIGALSFWIRETNIILLGGICFLHFVMDRRWFFAYAGGALVGFIPRLWSSQFFFDDPFYYILAESFSIQNIPANIGIYAVYVLILMPFFLVFLALYRGRYRWPVLISSVVFIIMYLTYSFNATRYSGMAKGTLFMGRFFLPLLPLYVITAGFALRNVKLNNWIKTGGAILLTIYICVMHAVIYKEASIHKSVSTEIYNEHSDDFVFFDLSRKTNIIRYINEQHGSFTGQADIHKVLDLAYVDKVLSKYRSAYLIHTVNIENSEKSKRTNDIQTMIGRAKSLLKVTLEKKQKIKNQLFLEVYKIEPHE